MWAQCANIGKGELQGCTEMNQFPSRWQPFATTKPKTQKTVKTEN